MGQDPDEDRIRRKAHELWVAEGHPHGRDQDHWEQAREIIAIEDSQASTLLPRDTGAEEPEEPSQSVGNLGDVPNLTDQGEHALTDVSREPEVTSPSHFINATGDTAGAVARPLQERTPHISDPEIVMRKPRGGAAAAGTPVATATKKVASGGKASPGGKSAVKRSAEPESSAKKGGPLPPPQKAK